MIYLISNLAVRNGCFSWVVWRRRDAAAGYSLVRGFTVTLYCFPGSTVVILTSKASLLVDASMI